MTTGAAKEPGRPFKDGQWYNTAQALRVMAQDGARMSRTTFWRRVSGGDIKWKLRVNFPGKWFTGRELNRFYNATYGA